MGLKIKLEILKIIYEYSKKKKIIDKYAIDKIIEIVADSKNLNDYIKNVSYTTDRGINVGNYNVANKELSIAISSQAIAPLLENLNQSISHFTDYEAFMAKNFYLCQFILHELEHVYQNKVLEQGTNDSIENTIIRTCFIIKHALDNPDLFNNLLNQSPDDLEKLNINMHDLMFYTTYNPYLYSQTYEFNPIERLAEIKSLTTIKTSLETIKDSVPNLYKILL